MNEKRSFPVRKSILFSIIAIVLAIVVVEVVASYALLLRMRIVNSQDFTKTEPSYLSLISIPYKAGVKAGLFSGTNEEDGFEYYYKWNPRPHSVRDPALGYRQRPGKSRLTFSRRAPGSDSWEHFRVNDTRLADRTRWTGEPGADPSSTVYVFGDSVVAGWGVNDEQTFSYLLQQARKDLGVRLFANGGYGMTQSYILFNQLRDQIGPDDIIILGYADYYDIRNVVSPSRLRETETWFKEKYRRRVSSRVMLPKATVDDEGAIQISYIQQRCSAAKGYCEQNDPPKPEMTRVTAALVNHIARNTEAKIVLLHFDGDRNNPVLDLLDDSIIKVSALPDDFDYFIRDDVEGFDSHPGPYWHYAMSRRLLEALDRDDAAD